ncbi:NAD(P)-binding domain-containing protein [Loktanella sp. M215]|uniref:NAD(P)-binding domain-containing protein n=1 Tax=Loktanella sp. M215 TaxID=2675431 RepID=UPI001F0250C6|nr:NAD(P)-binding domain-containing protein [Loktanella sp. M215]
MSDENTFRVCVIGLGSMGMGAALSCLRAGLATSGIDLSRARLDAFAAAGGEAVAVAATEFDLQFDAALVLVVNAAQAREAILGETGIAHRMRPGGAIMVSCTQSATDAQALGQDIAARGFLMLDAPVSGGAAKAASGDMTVMASGSEEAFCSARPGAGGCRRQGLSHRAGHRAGGHGQGHSPVAGGCSHCRRGRGDGAGRPRRHPAGHDV